MNLQSAIGQDIYAKVQLGIWALPQTSLSASPDLSKLTKTLYPGDYIGRVTGVQMVGDNDPWFTLSGGGFVHAVESNISFTKVPVQQTAGFGWIGGLLLALIIGGAIYESMEKKKT
jgi:hypothetical protein